MVKGSHVFTWIGLMIVLAGCSTVNGAYEVKNVHVASEVKTNSSVLDLSGEKSVMINKAITDQKVMTLTFQGLGEESALVKLLDELDRFDLKGVFFVSGVEVAEDAKLAQLVLERGHELGNSTLSGIDLTTVDDEKKLVEIQRSHDEILKATGYEPKYLRVGHNSIDESILMVAKACGYDEIIGFNINPQDAEGKSAEEVAQWIDQKKQRGSIILLNAQKNTKLSESIELIYDVLKEKSFELVTLDKVVELQNERLATQFVLGDDWYVTDEPSYTIMETGDLGDKKIALTFDDWATDDTVDSILDTLDEYGVQATFFLRAKGVEQNPSLAYAIAQRGHEVASHTYQHIDLDLLSDAEIQDDLIKAHEVISYAINEEAKRYLRPPRGVMSDEIAEVVAQCGYEDIIMYGPTALDWEEDKTAQEITDYMLSHTYGGAILLLHILDNISTPEALPHILEGLLAQGYEFVTVSEMIETEGD